jgi:hypothetical protein
MPTTWLPHAASKSWPLAQSLSDSSPPWHKHQVDAFFRRGGDCKENPHSPNPNPSDPLAWPNPSEPLTRLDQTYLLIHLATHAHSAHTCSTHVCSACTIATPPLPAGLYIPPHHQTHRPAHWTIGLMIIDAYHLDYLIPYSLSPSCLLASLFHFH